jgi:hypothetical protein
MGFKLSPSTAPAGPQGNDPLMGFKTPGTSVAAPAPPTDPNAYQSPSWLPGASFLHKAGNVFDNAFTANWADPATAKAGELLRQLGVKNTTPNVQALRAQTAQNRADIGPIASTAADVAGYGMGAGKILPGGAGIGGAALQGGLYNAAAGAGAHSDTNPLLGAAAGGAAGAVAGGIGGAASKWLLDPLLTKGANVFGKMTGLLSDPAAVTAQAKAASDAAYAPLSTVKFAPNRVTNAYDSAYQSLDADQRANLSGGMDSLINKHYREINNNNSVTASNIDGFARGLNEKAATGSNADGVLAARITDNLQGDTGVLSTAPTLTGHAPGAAAQMQDTAQNSFKQYANAKALQDMSAKLKDWGTSPAGAAQTIAEKFYPGQSDARKALVNIAQQSGGSGQTAYNLMHLIDPVLGYVGASAGGGPGALVGEMVGHLMKPGLASALTKAQQGASQRAIGAAYPTLTGAAPSLVSPSTGNLLRALISGQLGASGF